MATELDLDLIQGLWTEQQYLRLTGSSQRLLEFTNGVLEMLPMPTPQHQRIARLLFLALNAFMERIGGLVLFSPLDLKLPGGKFREPDLVVLLDEDDPRQEPAY